ncbi:MAG: serine/threonine protein kinase [Myxococcota bacterium]|jgi:serine/threonine protein kinase
MAESINSGEELPGGYRVGEAIGGGGIAAVHAATDANGNAVVVKFLHRGDADARSRFDREVTVLRAIPANEHIVRYLGHGTAGGTPFLVMERIIGTTLTQILNNGRRFDEAAACSVMMQLCEAFAPMHQMGLAHCDVEPGNIMFSRADAGSDGAPIRVHLLDFDRVHDAQGLLELFEKESAIPGILGNVSMPFALETAAAEHIAPELFWDAQRTSPGDAQTDTPADVFGLGVIFFQLLTGRSPWPFEASESERASALRHYLRARCGTGYTLKRPDDIGATLWSIVIKALDRDPKRRQRDAEELAADIRRYQAYGVGVVAAGEDEGETIMAVLPGVELSPLPAYTNVRPPSLPSRPQPTTLAQALEVTFGTDAARPSTAPSAPPSPDPVPHVSAISSALAGLARPEVRRRLVQGLWILGGFGLGLGLFLGARSLF